MSDLKPNELYQYSVINVLAAGEASQGITAAELGKKGSIGLGTWKEMRGELVMVDHTTYEMLGDGSVAIAPADREIPFAVASLFKGQKSIDIPEFNDKYTINDALGAIFPENRNNFITYVIHGTFDKIHARAVKGQRFPGQTLTQVSAEQAEFDFDHITGTLIGFSSPQPWGGITVTGQHTHFISDDRKHGGHVLSLQARNITVDAAVISDVHIQLPLSKPYNEANLEVDYSVISNVE